jgi:enediyne biosynthesis protein E4
MSVRAPWAIFFLLSGCLEQPSGYTQDPEPASLMFVEWTTESGLVAEHRLSAGTVSEFQNTATPEERKLLPLASGMAIGDVDQDGWTDVVVLTGQGGAALFRNNMDGTFDDATKDFALELDPLSSGPLLADFDADGFLDLLVGGIGDEHIKLLRNDGGVRFEDATVRSGLESDAKVLAVSAGDADNDGDLDVLFARAFAVAEEPAQQRFWLNDGTGRFTDASERLVVPSTRFTSQGDAENDATSRAIDAGGDAGLDGGTEFAFEVSIAPTFADLDGDGDQDLALVQDLGQSALIDNAGLDAGLPTFASPVRVDVPLGRGSALGDYDNDGDLDWFVSGIDAESLPEFSEGDGNHLLENQGDGTFRDVTERSRVADGSFAFGACFEDFDNDGLLDLFQVNGWGHLSDGPDAGSLRHDASRLFRNLGNGTFEEVASLAGLVDEGEGRAVACFDYDHDGDVDIAVTNAGGEVTFYGNTLNPWYTTGANYVCVSLLEDGPRTTVGVKVSITTDAVVQTREVLLGSYVSQTSTELHFGVGDEDLIDRIDIEWTDGDTGRVSDWSANNCLLATHLPESE